MEEFVVLVNDKNEQIGTMPKLEAHNAATPLHRAFSSYVFNEKGEFLLTQRALSKKVWPGIWTNSCCGHPGPDERTEDALVRRLDYELGLKPLATDLALPDFRYRVELNGIVENEICPVYLVRVDKEPVPNDLEVEAYRWVKWATYLENIEKHPDAYSEWSVLQIAELKQHPLVNSYRKQL